MSGALARISSHWNLWEAELACARLEAENIRARLGNATFLLWVWHYGNATGGVTVHVADRDAEAAEAILMPENAEPEESRSSWVCSSCGTRGFSTWDTCWSCGASLDGVPSLGGDEGTSRPAAPPSSADRGGSVLLAAVVTLAAAAIYVGGGVLLLFSVVSLAALTVLIFQEWSEEAAPPATEPAIDHARNGALEARPAGLAGTRNSIVERAWRASVLSLSFPPLALYAVWLLWRVLFRQTRLGRADRLRSDLALVLAVPWAFAIVAAPLLWVYWAVGPLLGP